MSNIRFLTLYSGSEGNATYISVGSTEILIDAGKSARTLCAALRDIGTDIKNISAIFITHEHTDHVSALEVISKHNEIPIHMMEQSATRFDCSAYCSVHRNLVRHEREFCERVGELTVSCFRTPHDSRMSVGYRIEFEDGESIRALGVATDIGYVTDEIFEGLRGCEAVVLESNHDPDMLRDCRYPSDLKRRIASNRGHLSNPDSAALAGRLFEGGTRGFILAHISKESDCPEIALDEYICSLGTDGVEIRTASAKLATELKCFSAEADEIDKYKVCNSR